jgi:hypothetical protein
MEQSYEELLIVLAGSESPTRQSLRYGDGA